MHVNVFSYRSDKPSGTIRSFADRSMGEMSIHDQLVMMQNDEDAAEDSSIQEYRCVFLCMIGTFLKALLRVMPLGNACTCTSGVQRFSVRCDYT